MTITENGLESGIQPWLQMLQMPHGFSFGPEDVISLNVPENAPCGDYVFAALASEMGAFKPVGEWHTCHFSILGSP